MAEREPGQPESVEGLAAPAPAGGATSFLQRAVVRRRVRFLSRRRELALHDLGGFLFESHRLGTPREELLADKLSGLVALDDELALLQRSLDLREELAVFREPGISSCAYCATLRDSSANFCPHCGLAAGSPAPATSDGDHAAVPAAVEPVATGADAAPEATEIGLEADEVDLEPTTAVHAPAAPLEVALAPVQVEATPDEVPTAPAVVEIEETTAAATPAEAEAVPVPPERAAEAADAAP